MKDTIFNEVPKMKDVFIQHGDSNDTM